MVCHAEEPTGFANTATLQVTRNGLYQSPMTTIAIVLLIISAFTHAGWNFISKKEHPTQAFYLVANSIGVICILPILFYYASFLHFVPASVWLIVIMSGFFLASYMGALAGAYRAGDISIAYPLTRSLPVILVFLLTLIMNSGQPTGGWFFVGIILVVTGCVILPLKAFGDFHFSNYKNLCCLLAVLAALGVTGYTVADDRALRFLRELPGQPMSPVEGTLLYMVLEGISSSVWQALFVVVNRKERQSISTILKSYKSSAALPASESILRTGLFWFP